MTTTVNPKGESTSTSVAKPSLVSSSDVAGQASIAGPPVERTIERTIESRWTGSWSHGDFFRSLWKQYFLWGLISPTIRKSGGADTIRQDRELEPIGGTGTLSSLFRSFSAHPHLPVAERAGVQNLVG